MSPSTCRRDPYHTRAHSVPIGDVVKDLGDEPAALRNLQRSLGGG